MTRVEVAGTIDLDKTTFDGLIEHALSDAPFEVCGMLASPEPDRLLTYRIPNAARSMTYYNMDSKALLRAMREIDDNDYTLTAIYHSHTHTEAFPSATDIQLAAYPDVAYVIISLQEPDEPVIRAFDIVDGDVTERVVTLAGEEVAAGPR